MVNLKSFWHGWSVQAVWQEQQFREQAEARSHIQAFSMPSRADSVDGGKREKREPKINRFLSGVSLW